MNSNETEEEERAMDEKFININDSTRNDLKSSANDIWRDKGNQSEKCHEQPIKEERQSAEERVTRIRSQRRHYSLGGQSTNQLLSQHEQSSFYSNTYTALQKGNVVRGILCPSFSNSFR